MAIVQPFKAVRPSRDKVALVSSKSYEAYTSAELGAKLNSNPFSFLQVLNPGYQNHQEISKKQRFQAVRNKYLTFKEDKVFTKDNSASFYIYEITEGNSIFCGVIAKTSVNDYKANVIKKHEETIHKRELLFKKYLKVTGFNAEPVLLTFKDDTTLEKIMAKEKIKIPKYEFSTTDKRLHKLWVVTDENIIKKVINIFCKIDALYIADGHHRSASSALLAKDLALNNEHHKGNEDYQFFMSYLIPESHLKIASFNRFIRDLNGLTIDEFLLKLNTYFRVHKKENQNYTPTKKHHFSMYINGEFYALYLRENKYDFTDALSKLDSEILYRTILNPILNINDVTNNNRIEYSYSKNKALDIKTKVDSGLYAVGFGLIPININEMKEIADANLKMPPKTTYIQPKLRSGLTLYEF